MENINILIVEDDQAINNLLREIMAKNNFTSYQAYSGTEAQLLMEAQDFQLVLVDLMLPGLAGEDLVEIIRRDRTLPIIVISAKLDMETKVRLLSLGADDFIEKPFDIDEVAARVKAQLRRYLEFSRQEEDQVLAHKNLYMNLEERTSYIKDQPLRLTAKEYEILRLLLEYPKKVFTKANLYDSIWGESEYIDDNTLNVHISNIRTKIASHDQEEYIETVWGIGFKLKA